MSSFDSPAGCVNGKSAATIEGVLTGPCMNEASGGEGQVAVAASDPLIADANHVSARVYEP
jgi:hypothetical protein